MCGSLVCVYPICVGMVGVDNNKSRGSHALCMLRREAIDSQTSQELDRCPGFVVYRVPHIHASFCLVVTVTAVCAAPGYPTVASPSAGWSLCR